MPVTYDTHEENRKIVVAVAAMWQQAGVRTEISNVEFGALLAALRTKNYAVARSQTFSLYDDPYAFLQQYSARSPSNWAGWSDAGYDALLNRANAARDRAERLVLLAEAEARLLAAQPLIPVYHYQGKQLVASRVRGWWDAPIGTPPTRFLSLSEAEGRPLAP